MERQDAVSRARMMQYVETSRVRQLHARLLMSNVLYERECQIKYREEKRTAEKAAQAIERENLARMRNHADDEMILHAHTRHLRSLIAEDLRRVTEQKLFDGQLKRQEEKEQQSQLDRKVALEMREEMERLKEDKARRIIEMRSGLSEGIKTKKEEYQTVNEHERALEAANERFNDMKAYISRRKKEIEGQRAERLNQICDKVAAINEEMNKAKDEKLQKFVDAMGRAHFGDAEKREALEKIKRKNDANEIELFRLQKIKETTEYISRKKLDAITEREETAQKLKDSAAVEEKKKAKMKEGRQALKLFNLQQMINGENDRFNDYAMDAVKEFQDAGKNITPILRELRKNRPFPKTNIQPVDTFERLGFTLRNVPVEAPVLDKPMSTSSKKQLRDLIDQKLVRSGEKDK
ncbi:hypothetical protein HDU67_010004 [Dinochytrium kinnereticum]|nr:hypothetical protein HDU67_010004 [Dinochytrium kinnereticum]